MQHMSFTVDPERYGAQHRRATSSNTWPPLKLPDTSYYVVLAMDREQVVFLYKLKPGAASKSFGMNVAAMAGVPTEVRPSASQCI